MKKSQAALEFLTTYAWAFVVLIILISAMAYFGYLKPNKLLPDRCNFGPEIGCSQYVLKSNGLQLKLKNNAGTSIILDSLTVFADTQQLSCSSVIVGTIWEANQVMDFPIICDFTGLNLVDNEKSKLRFDFSYHVATAGSIFKKNVQGEVSATKGNSLIDIPKSCSEILSSFPSTKDHDGSYTIDPDGQGGIAQFDVYCDMTTSGGGWTRILTLIDNGAKTNNMLNKGITFTTIRAVKATDRTIYRQATFNTAQPANLGLIATANEPNTQVFLTTNGGGGGGYGVYIFVTGPCNWGGNADAIGAGYDGSTCGTEASLKVGRVAGTTMPERYNVDIFIK